MATLTLETLPDMLTTEDMREHLNLATVQQAQQQIRIHRNLLQPIRVGREYRIPKENYQAYLQFKQQESLK